MRHFQPIMKSEILRDAENLRHNNNWDMVHCMRRRDSLQVAAESWNAEPGKHFPTPVTSSCNVTDSALQSVTAWQSRARHKMSLGAVQYFLRVMPPVLPESHNGSVWQPHRLTLGQYLEALCRCHRFFTIMISAPCIITPATQLRSNLYRILEKESKSLYHAWKNVAAAVAVLTSLSHCKSFFRFLMPSLIFRRYTQRKKLL